LSIGDSDEHVRAGKLKAADEGAKAARETVRKGRAKTEQSLEASQEGFQMAGDSARQMNLKLLEIMRANTEAFFEFAEDMATAKDPSKLIEIWTKHTQKQMELLVNRARSWRRSGSS
jgi:hypothetical protein